MNIIRENKKSIMEEWQILVREAIPAAADQSKLALYDSLPDFLENLAKIIEPKNSTEKVIATEKEDLIGKVHGQHRANNSYAIDQMIDEYFILKDVVLSHLRKNGVLTLELCELISVSFQKTVQISAAQFSKSLLESQEDFILSLAHDLRSPLMVIKMQAELNNRKKEFNQDTNFKIIKSVDKVDGMIEHLLTTVKTNHETFRNFDSQEFDLNVLVHNVVSDYEDLYPGIIKVEGQSTLVKWNQHSFERVIDNLVSNSIKYGDEELPVTIKIKQDERNIFFSIHNFGEPISREDQVSLFEKFKRTKQSKGKKGWGIGLSYVKSIVEAHKGIVMVHSDEKGTEFKFEIPKDVTYAQKQSLEVSKENDLH